MNTFRLCYALFMGFYTLLCAGVVLFCELGIVWDIERIVILALFLACGLFTSILGLLNWRAAK